MAVNLSKNGNELMAAYKDVLDGKTATNWALFTYEGNSNDIRLAEKGDGGLEEMVEELNSGKVMYAFCRVEDPNSGLPKYVLVNWTGEGVNSSRKGICANHVSSMGNFLKGAHVTINARDEDDVEPKFILNKVSKASGASFNFSKHKQGEYVDVPRGKVGSVYRKVNAVEEIQQTDKDDFWDKTQRDEEIRKKEELKKAELDRQQLEKERRGMEEQQSRERERRAKERAQQIEQDKMHQKQREQEEREKEIQRRSFETTEEKKSINRAASVQKANEAKSLISQRSFNPRDVFKQREQSFDANNGANPAPSRPGKLQSPFFSQRNSEAEITERPRSNISLSPEPAPSPSLQPPASRFRPPSPERDYSPHLDSSPTPLDSSPTPFDSSPTPPVVALSPELSAASPDVAYHEEGEWSDEFDDDVDEGAPAHQPGGTEDDLYQNVQYTAPVEENHTDASGQGISARAIYDYQAADDTEITFDPDDIITRIEMIDDGWWRGVAPNGQYGMFPSNYVELL